MAELVTVAGPRRSRYLVLVLGFGAAVVLIATDPNFSRVGAAAIIATSALWIFRLSSPSSVAHSRDDLVVDNKSGVSRVPKEGARVEIREVVSREADFMKGRSFPGLYGAGRREGLERFAEKEPSYAKTLNQTSPMLFVIPGAPDAAPVRVDRGIGKTPAQLEELAQAIETAIAER